MVVRGTERGVWLSWLLQCWLLAWTAVCGPSPDEGSRIILWGWWKPSPSRYPDTSTALPSSSAAVGSAQADLGDPGSADPAGGPAYPLSTSTEGPEVGTSTAVATGSSNHQATTPEGSTETDVTQPTSAGTTTQTTSQPTTQATTQPTTEATSLATNSSAEVDTPAGCLEAESSDVERPRYSVYWNVPTFQCHKYGLNFSRVAEWGLEQNPSDDFRGEAIAILYDPGEFPALLSGSGGSRVPRNGGVPQEASLGRHLTIFAQHVDKLIPDPRFSGLGVIDFEHWRPVWRQNWGTLAVYRDYSRQIERLRNPFWFSSIVEAEAKFKYELAARTFLLETLRMAKRLRPLAKWGYYGYPFCFNYTPNNNRPSCSDETRRDNDGMSWMFEEVTSHFPSLYLKERDMHPWKRRSFVEGRLEETSRIAGDAPVFPYLWYKYHDTNQFLSEDDMRSVLLRPVGRGCRGAVIWGASRDVNSREKCLALADYLERVIGPAVRELAEGGWSQRFDLETTTPTEEPEEEDTFPSGYDENVPYVG